jgi:hypothetical protein
MGSRRRGASAELDFVYSRGADINRQVQGSGLVKEILVHHFMLLYLVK